MPSKKKNPSREEILEKKREAESLRYKRMKNDPVKHAEMKEKERLKYQKKKEKGQRKLVKDMDPRERRAAKKTWKKHCTTYRTKKKVLKDVTNRVLRENTPELLLEQPPAPARPEPINLQCEQQKRRQRRERRIQKKAQKERIKYLKKRVSTLQKRCERLQNASKNNKAETPNTKLHKMVEDPDGRKEVVKKALFGDVLNTQLKKNYSKLKSLKDKQIFSQVISGDLVKKYKLWRGDSSAISYKHITKSKPTTSLNVPQKKRLMIAESTVQQVKRFYEDDSNSRMGAGKKEYVTRKSLRKQKRYLLDTLLNLYQKFSGDSNIKLSYQTFCRLRPFWVVKPKEERDTCLCMVHSNLDLKLSALHEAKIISYDTHQKLFEDLCCNSYNVDCLSRRCQGCINKTPPYNEFDDAKPIKYKKWISEKEEFLDPKTKKLRRVTKFTKKTFEIHPRQLISDLHEDLPKFFQHQTNIVHQFNAIHELKGNLSEVDVLIHMDFSENYATKFAEEIQAFHFGGSRVQLSLHTVVVYLPNSKQSYCTVSKNLSHSPPAIWTHLQPIFESLPSGIRRVHFLSDGPVTQYRNKTMFYILATKLPEEVPEIKSFSWNYTESGHGKGAPDGFGGTCKRTADFIVNTGGDVNNLDKFVDAIQERCPGITCLTIDEKEIDTMTSAIQKEAPMQKGFKGTLQVLQVTGRFEASSHGFPKPAKTLTMKNLSCFCDEVACNHFKLGTLTYDYKLKLKLTTDTIYTDSEPDDTAELGEAQLTVTQTERNYKDVVAVAGPSNSSKENLYNIGDYILVKYPVKNQEYRYAAVINSIDEEESDLRVTFLKVCDDKAQKFRLDEKDISDISFEQIVKKLENPDLVLKGNRIFYKFAVKADVFEKLNSTGLSILSTE